MSAESFATEVTRPDGTTFISRNPNAHLTYPGEGYTTRTVAGRWTAGGFTEDCTGGVDVGSLMDWWGIKRLTPEQINQNWDAIAAAVRSKTDEQMLVTHPGMDRDALARWRELAANPPQVKGAADWWYTQAEVTS
jgi:hypothetical protein